MKAILKFSFEGKESESSVEQGSNLEIGRSSNCQTFILDHRVSSHHCRILLKKNSLEIIDLDSKNGTYLNGIKIERSEIFIGDEITIGKTSITLVESKMPADVVDLLTFPGPHRERISYELKADFTGARIENQLHHKNHTLPRTIDFPSHVREVSIRKKVNSTIQLSKKEIRVKHKFLSLITTLTDTFLVFSAFCLPLTSIADLVSLDISKEDEMLISIGMMIASGMIFTVINFKASQFTLGERFSGIKDLYLKQ